MVRLCAGRMKQLHCPYKMSDTMTYLIRHASAQFAQECGARGRVRSDVLDTPCVRAEPSQNAAPISLGAGFGLDALHDAYAYAHVLRGLANARAGSQRSAHFVLDFVGHARPSAYTPFLPRSRQAR